MVFPRTRSPALLSLLQNYGIALIASMLALVLTWLLLPVTEQSLFLFFYAAVVISALYGGLGPGLLTTVFAVLSVSYFFISPVYSLNIGLPSLLELLVFALVAVLTSSLTQARRHAELRAQDQGEQFRVTLASIGDAVMVTDTAGAITFMNPVAEELTGWSLADTLGMPCDAVFQIVNADTREKVESPVTRVLREGMVVGLANHTLLLAKDGSEHAIDDSGAPIRAADGLIRGVVLVFRDVTERQRTEADLQASRDQLAVILQGVADGITAQDRSGRLVYANDAAAQTSGYRSAYDMLHTPPMEILQKFILLDEAGERFPFDRLPGRLALQGEQSPETILRFREVATGAERWSIVKATPVRDAQGRVQLAINIFHDITQRKRAEAAQAQLLVQEQAARAEAEAAKEQITSILASITDGFMAFDRDWRFTYLNHEGARTLGRSLEDLLGKNLWEEFPELGETSFGQLYKQAMAEGVVLEMEDYYPPFDAWFAVRAYPSSTGLALYFRNVTERVAAVQALRASEERYRSLIQATTSVVWTTDSHGLFVEPQPAWHAYTGQPWPEHQGSGWANMVQPDDREEVQAIWLRAIAAGTVYEAQGRVWHAATNLHRYFLARAAPVINPDRSIREWIGTFTDIHEQKLAEQMARRAMEHTARLQRVTAGLSEALTPLHVGRVIVEQGIAALSAALGSVRQLTDDQTMLRELHITGDNDEQLALWRDIPMSVVFPLTDAVRAGTPIWLESLDAVRLYYPDLVALMQAHNYAALVSLPLLVEERVIGGIAFSFAEPRSFSTEDKAFMLALAQQCAQALERARLYEAERQARAEAEKAVHLRDEFFSVAAHELRTPLTSLMGNAQLMQRRAEREGILAERERRSIQLIVNQAARLNKMVLALLDVSRLETGQLTIQRERMDFCVLIRRIIDEIRPGMEGRLVDLVCPDDPLFISGDELRLEQVFQNLIQNAAKYSPVTEPIRVEVAQRDRQVCVAVIDRGIGIPQPDISQLFQRFYRAGNVDPRQVSGMGIGLYVVKEIVNLHGGTVSVDSTEGVGSTFMVCLPL